MTQDAQKAFTCLAIELAAGVGSVAACIGTQTTSREYPVPSMQSREIYSGVREVLDDLGLELAALDCIAFGCGPGAFTGLRVAAAAAQALAYGAGIPVARVSSLASLAAGAARRHSVDCVVP
ncbi:MAG: tRNA (adenosine(37)-N6)-threonylcarbamoyltransferase complex dimerization subunit type 1 TsaB, partial [Gammaproteobacteria bacterium]|nr:tRNA (adenosine(37)-N6)-threonylcarbamoyltransferase complex dimerization subunit type 1 TsaB [Gammaproteobacteria bacterium]